MTEAVTSFGDRIYVGTYNNSGNGAQLWRKQEVGLWEAIMTNGFGDPANNGVSYLIEFKNKLYAGTGNTNGGQLWRSDLGSDWNQVVSAGFGDATNRELNHLMVFDGMLYAATNSSSTTHGAEVWRSSTGNSDTGCAWSAMVSAMPVIAPLRRLRSTRDTCMLGLITGTVTRVLLGVAKSGGRPTERTGRW